MISGNRSKIMHDGRRVRRGATVSLVVVLALAQMGLVLLAPTPIEIASATPGIHVHVNPTTAAVTEGSATAATYTLQLGDAPPADQPVFITVIPGDEVNVTSPDAVPNPDRSITVVLEDTDAKTVFVTAVDDTIDESLDVGATHGGTITHFAFQPDNATCSLPSQPPCSSPYSGIPIPDVAVDVTDNDAPAIGILDATGPEGTGGATPLAFRVTLTNSSDVEVTVGLNTTSGPGGQAAEGTDFVSADSTTVTFSPGQTEKTVSVSLNGDTSPEGDEAFFVLLSDPGGGDATLTGGDDNATGTIDDDDSGVILSPNALVLAEAGGFDTYTVRLATAPSTPVFVTLTPDADVNVTSLDVNAFEIADRSLILLFTSEDFGPKTVNVTAVQDTIDESPDDLSSNHTGTISHSASGDDAYDGIAIPDKVASIADDDAPVISIAGFTKVEGDSGSVAFEFNVTLTKLSDYTIDVNYATDNGTATVADNDYQSTSGALVFSPGQQNKTIFVNVFGDNNVEPDEAFNVTLSGVSAIDGDGDASLSPDPNATGTIDTDDFPGISVDISPNTATVNESGLTDTYQISLSTTPDGPVEVTVAPDGEVEVSHATVPANPVDGSIVLVFTDTTSQTITVHGLQDANDEAEPHLGLITHSAVSSDGRFDGILIDNVTVDVFDDDPSPTITLSNAGAATASEGNAGPKNFGFRVDLNANDGARASEFNITVTFQTLGDGIAPNATEDVDFASGDGNTLVFTPGETRKTFNVVVNGDNDPEPFETFVVNISAVTDDNPFTEPSIVGTGNATGTIQNDDPSVIISPNNNTLSPIVEGTSTTYTVRLASIPANGVPVVVTVDPDGETQVNSTQPAGPTDGNLTLVFRNTDPQTVTVTARQDMNDELDAHQGIVRHTSASTDPNFNARTWDNFTLSIIDDDAAPTIVVSNAGDATATEGNFPGTKIFNFRVQLNTNEPATASEFNVTVTFQTIGDGIAPNAMENVDFISGDGQTLTFSPGETRKQFPVTVIGDNVTEVDEPFTVNISALIDDNPNATEPVIGGSGNATGTITNDDVGVLISPLEAGPVAEGATATYTIQLATNPAPSNAGATPVVITVDSDDDADVSTAGGPPVDTLALVFTNRTAQTITVHSINDEIDEPAFHNSTVTHEATARPDSPYSGIAIDNFTLNITDDDNVVVSIISLTGPVDEGNTGTTPSVFELRLTNKSEFTVNVTLQSIGDGVGPNNATEGVDFESIDGRIVSFAPGEDRKTTSVNVIGDTLEEDNENFTLNISAVLGGDIFIFGTGNVNGTIIDDDPFKIVITQSGGTTNVTEAGAIDSYTVRLSEGPTGTVVVRVDPDQEITIMDAAGKSNADGTVHLVFTPINFGAPQTIGVTAVDDAIDESLDVGATHPGVISHSAFSNDQDFVDNSSVAPAILTTDLTVNVTDNDVPLITIGDVTKLEGDGGPNATAFEFMLTMSRQSDFTVTATVATIGDGIGSNATEGVDFWSDDGGIVSFAPGVTTATLQINVTGDLAVEPDEIFDVTLSLPTGGDADFADDLGRGTILNDDLPPPNIVLTNSSGSTSVVEDGAADTYTVKLDRAPDGPVVVTITPDAEVSVSTATQDSRAGGSISLGFTEATFGLPQTVTVTAVDDTIDEFAVHASAIAHVAMSSADPAFDGISKSLAVSVTDDDIPLISVGDVREPEGTTGLTPLVFPVTLSKPSEFQVTALVNTNVSGIESAVENVDYVSGDGLIVTFAPMVMLFNLTINATGDVEVELDETFNVTLSAPAGGDAAIGDGIGLGTILNDDAGVLVSPTNLNAVEGAGGTTSYTIALQRAPNGTVVVIVDPDEEVLVATNAVAPPTGENATLVFTPENFDDPQTVFVAANDDDIDEASPHVGIIRHNLTATALDSEFNAIVVSNVVVQVTDDDAPTIDIEDAEAEEADVGSTTPMVFTVTLSAPSEFTVTAAVSTASGGGPSGATEDVDFESGDTFIVSFAPLVTEANVTINITGDAIVEADENFTVTLSSPSGGSAAIGDGSAEGVILDNEGTPGVTVTGSPLVILEGGSGTYTVQLATAPNSGNVVIDLSVTGDAADNITLKNHTSGSVISNVTLSNTAVFTVRVEVAENPAIGPDQPLRATISHAVNMTLTSEEYDGESVDAVEVLVVDNDVQGSACHLDDDVVSVCVGPPGALTGLFGLPFGIQGRIGPISFNI